MIRPIAQFISQALNLDKAPTVEIPSVKNFGHYSTNIALTQAKVEKKDPMNLAGEYLAKLKEANKENVFSKIEIASPGFINFWLSNGFLQSKMEALSKEKEIKGINIGKREKVIIEYSSPNIAKQMHVGNLRGSIIGDALSNIHDFLGYKVIRWNYLGDWGTQFGKLITAYKLWGEKKIVEMNPIDTLNGLYVRFHDELKNNPALEERGQKEFQKLEFGDRENRKLWKWFRKESLKEFNRIYNRLGTKFDVILGEDEYGGKKLLKFLNEMEKKGIANVSEGGLVISLDEYSLPTALIRKSDGATLYLSRDILLFKERVKKYKPKKILILTGHEQDLHFRQLTAITKILELGGSMEFKHIKYGLVLGEDGKRLSTREGKAVKVEDLVNGIVEKAYEVVSKKNPNLSTEEKTKIAEVIGVGALKYNDLKENRNSDIVFDWKQMLDFVGNSAPYLQYTYSRLQKIVTKAGKIEKANVKALSSDLEIELMKKVLDFEDAVLISAQTQLTSHLSVYLHSLAKLANNFYQRFPILKDEDKGRRGARLILIGKTAKILQKGLELLGIKTLERI